jgi:chromosome segregation ATPase
LELVEKEDEIKHAHDKLESVQAELLSSQQRVAEQEAALEVKNKKLLEQQAEFAQVEAQVKARMNQEQAALDQRTKELSQREQSLEEQSRTVEKYKAELAAPSGDDENAEGKKGAFGRLGGMFKKSRSQKEEKTESSKEAQEEALAKALRDLSHSTKTAESLRQQLSSMQKKNAIHDASTSSSVPEKPKEAESKLEADLGMAKSQLADQAKELNQVCRVLCAA